MAVTFPWSTVEATPWGNNHVSYASVKVQAKNGQWRRLGFKIDSGADITMMQPGDMSMLGFTEDECELTSLRGIGGNSSGRIRRTNMQIGQYVISDVPICFSSAPLENLLLGRMGLFENLKITFIGATRRTTFSV